jgi:PAS domain S-box-containing protein
MDGMDGGSIALAASWLGEADGTVLVAALVVLLVLLAVALVISVRIVSRRRWSDDIREVVVGLEDLRAGNTRQRIEIQDHSPLTLVADAVNRLAQDMQVRLADAASTSERLRLVMDAFKDSAIITTDLDGDIRTFSSGAEHLLGWTEEEARSQPSSILFDAEAYKEFLPELSQRALKERGSVARTTLRRKDGTTLPAVVTARALHGSQQEPRGVLMVVQDVTQQVHLEEQLRRSEDRYRRLVEGLSDGVAIVRAGRLLYVNPAFSGLCAVPGGRLVGTPLRDRIATRDVLMVEERLGALERHAGATDEIDCTLVSAEDGRQVDVRIHATTVDYEGGVASLLLVHDETATRRIEQELRGNETQLDAVLEATSDGILVLVDGPGRPLVQMTNRAFLRMFAMRQQDVLGLPQARLVAMLEERGGGAARVGTLLAAGTPAPHGDAVRLQGPTPKDLQVSLIPLADRDGRRIGNLLVCRDLTRQRESERKLQDHAEQLQLSKVMLERAYAELDRANRELHGRSEELDRLNQELRRLDEMRSQLLGNAAHELQAPLVAIRGYTEMILKERLGPISEEQRKGLSLSLKNIDRLIGLIDRMSGVSDEDELTVTRFPLRTLVEEAAGLLRSKMEAKAIHFSLEMPKEGPEIEADRDKILQVFINVLSNAIKFNKQGGSIEVALGATSAGRVRVAIEDTGVGIEPAEIPKVFDRHFRAASAQEDEGRGLGLSIVREILSRHGCDIEAHSEPGAWTRISFTLPLATEEAPAASESDDTDGVPMPSEAAETTAEEEPEGRPEPPAPRFRVIRRYRRR